MTLAPMTDLLAEACAGGYAVGYFEAWDSYSLEAVIEAAEAESAPVVLGFGCLLVDQQWLDAGGIEMLGCLGRQLAESARVPAALLLNETHTLKHALRGIDAGFNAVMLHTEDRSAVADLVQAARRHGVAVEGEVGTLPDAHPSGRIDVSNATLTSPYDAAAFLAATGVDCLAVSFGNVHTLEGAAADVDLDLLDAIHRHARVPLVVHGGTGFPAEAVTGAISRGVAKFNVGTALKRTFLEGFRAALASVPGDASPHDLVGSHGDADLLMSTRPRLVQLVRNLIRLYGGSGRAT